MSFGNLLLWGLPRQHFSNLDALADLAALVAQPRQGYKKLTARRLVRRVLEERLRDLVVRRLPDDARKGLLTAYDSAI